VPQAWTRDLRYHPHVHVLLPGAGLTADGPRWFRVKAPAFILPQVKLAARFRGRLLARSRAPEVGGRRATRRLRRRGRPPLNDLGTKFGGWESQECMGLVRGVKRELSKEWLRKLAKPKVAVGRLPHGD
jgi:hypothetical protein